jgi:hypothetical protein
MYTKQDIATDLLNKRQERPNTNNMTLNIFNPLKPREREREGKDR